jgi:hypothetical protein
MTPIFRGTVDDSGTLQFAQAVRGLLVAHLSKLRGKPIELTVRRFRQQRTDRQGRYYFGVVVPLIAEHCGYPKDEMHELLAMRFLRLDDDPVTGSPRRRHTPDTDTTEFATYVDQCIQFAAELDVYIPDPREVAA